MTTIDIRNGDVGEITKIQFSDCDEGRYYHACALKEEDDNDIQIVSSGDFLYVDRRDIKALTLALQKALELGWDR